MRHPFCSKDYGKLAKRVLYNMIMKRGNRVKEYKILYVIIINIIGYVAMMLDKRRAIQGKWRISEKTLFTIAILFGSVGISLGMKQFRHKTKHKSFVIGIPTIQILQIIAVIIYNTIQ